MGRRAKPTKANSRDSNCARARLYRAGISFRRVRSPEAPKITITHGSPIFPTGCPVVAGMVSILGIVPSNSAGDAWRTLVRLAFRQLLVPNVHRISDASRKAFSPQTCVAGANG